MNTWNSLQSHLRDKLHAKKLGIFPTGGHSLNEVLSNRPEICFYGRYRCSVANRAEKWFLLDLIITVAGCKPAAISKKWQMEAIGCMLPNSFYLVPLSGFISNLVLKFLQAEKPSSGKNPTVLAQCHCVLRRQPVVIRLTLLKVC